MVYSSMQKVKIDKKQNGEVFLDYCLVARPSIFRHCLLKHIVCSAGMEVMVMVDTNQRTPGKPLPLNEVWLEQARLRYAVMPAQANAQSIFGVNLSKLPGRSAKQTEQRIVIEFSGGAFPDEMLETLRNYDISLGFGRKKSFDEICQRFGAIGDAMLFDPKYFEDGLYASAVCARIRSTFGLNEHLEAVKYEVGL